MLIRSYYPGEEAQLHAIFHSAVHGLARCDYSAEQLHAWAPQDYDGALWSQRMRANQPLVAEMDGRAVAFADLQPSGYIDMFFVDAAYARRGVGSALLRHIMAMAGARAIGVLRSDVSLTAEPFFARHGFLVETRNRVLVRGVPLENATMSRMLA
jgi:putative acetyltransferase